MIKIIIMLAVFGGENIVYEVPTMEECLAAVEIINTFENSKAQCKEVYFFGKEA
jgi:hypothetical protein